jgi:hypothetical protein
MLYSSTYKYYFFNLGFNSSSREWFKTYGWEGQRGCITQEYNIKMPPEEGGQIINWELIPNE